MGSQTLRIQADDEEHAEKTKAERPERWRKDTDRRLSQELRKCTVERHVCNTTFSAAE